MKATDLMIGDWVFAKGKLTQVTDIDESDGINREWIGGVVCEDAGCIRWEHIKPIPLTPEILAKNADKIDMSYQFGGYPKTMNVMYDSRARARIMEGDDEYYGIELNYVHELQHALRLCGIDKEIEL